MIKYNNSIFPIGGESDDLTELYRLTLDTWNQCKFSQYTARLKMLKIKDLKLLPDPKISIRLPNVLDNYIGNLEKKKSTLTIEWKETISQFLERMAHSTIPLNKFFSQFSTHTRDSTAGATKDILKTILDHFVAQPQIGRPKYLVFKEMRHPNFYPNGVIAGIVSDSYLTIRDTEMLEYASNRMAEFGNFSIHSINITPNKSEYRFSYDDSDRSNVEIRKGDIIRGWIGFSNNMWGRGGLNVSVGGERLLCGNGLIAPFTAQRNVIAHIKRKDESINQAKDRILQDLTSNIEKCFEILDKWFKFIKRATEIKVDEPVKQIEEIGKRFSVSKAQVEEVAENYKKYYSDDSTLYGISNAFNYDTDNEDRMVIAGEILTWNAPLPIPITDSE